MKIIGFVMRPYKKRSGFQQRIQYLKQRKNKKVTDYSNVNNSSSISNNSCTNDSCNYRLENSDNNSNSDDKKK